MSIVSNEIDALPEASITERPTDERIRSSGSREPKRSTTS